MLMGCAVDYDDDVERSDIPSVLLPRAEEPVDPSTVTSIVAPSSTQGKDRRSVLGGDVKRPHAMWNTSQNRVDVNNEKLRKRHLELVIDRVMKAQAASAT
jgi:hypothetical protein